MPIQVLEVATVKVSEHHRYLIPMENSLYMNGRADARAVLLGIEGTMDGESLVSVETVTGETSGIDLYTYARSNWGSFSQVLRKLSYWDREMLLTYIICGKPQWMLGELYFTTQTLCGSALRRITETVASHLLFPSFSVEQLQKVLLRCECEHLTLAANVRHQTRSVQMSLLIDAYRQCGSFAEVAQRFGLKRSAMRKQMVLLPELLKSFAGWDVRAVSSHISTLFSKQDPQGPGLDERHKRKLMDVTIVDRESLGAFNQRITRDGRWDNGRFFPSAHC